MWRVRFVLSVCSLVMTRENLCVRFLNELLVVRLSFVVKLFMLRSWFRSFRVEILVSLLYSISRISNSCFRVEFRISNSYFEVVFWSRIFVSLLYSTSRISIFRFVFRIRVPRFSRVRISRRNSRFVARFDFSNFVALFDFSNFDFSIRISNSSTSIFSSSNFSSKFSFRCSIRLLEFRFEIVVEILIRKPNFLLLLSTDVSHLFSHVHSHFALVATRALRALFVRKILVKRQFTFSLYFGIIEL